MMHLEVVKINITCKMPVKIVIAQVKKATRKIIYHSPATLVVQIGSRYETLARLEPFPA
jgi:hypothetical protein